MQFYDSIHKYYNEIFPLNKAQVDFVKYFVQEKNAQLLDVGCATGELAHQLAHIGYHVNAFDFDESMIKLARQKSTAQNPKLKVGNMLTIANDYPSEYFDGITCFGNTLVHLTKHEWIEQFLNGAYSVLKPQGKVLIQILNYSHIISQKITSLPLIENEHIKFIRNYEFLKNGLINFKTELLIKDSNQLIKNEVGLLPIESNLLEELLLDAGFSELEIFGNFAREEFLQSSLPIVIKAKK